MNIPFTQYLRPNGERREVSAPCPENLKEQAQQLLKTGHRFEIEELMTGMISMTVEALDDDEPPIGHEICSNDESVTAALAKLVESAAKSCGR